MTSTPSADPNQQRFNVLRKAGTLFGLDLSGLFEDDGEGSSTGFGGLVPSFQVTSYLKGRSPSTLTYKTPKTPARETTFSLTAPSEAVQTPTAPTAQPAAQPAAQPPAPVVPKTYNVDISSGLSAQKFGHEDYFKNLEAGVPTQFLQSWVQQNAGLLDPSQGPGTGGLYDQIMSGNVKRTSGLNVSPQQQLASLGTTDTSKMDLGQYLGSQSTAGTFGAPALQRARAAGLSEQQIKDMVATQGYTLGEDAKGMLYPQAAAPSGGGGGSGGGSGSGGGVSQFLGSQSQAGLFGGPAAQRALAAGMSPQQIASQAAAAGRTLGPDARRALGL